MKKLEIPVKANRKVVILLLAATVAAVAVGCAPASFGKIFGGSRDEATEITALPLAKTNLSDTLSLSGTVYSDNTQNVYSTLTYPVKEILVEVGDKVKAGDVLAVLDTKDLEFEIKQAENNYESALANASDDEKTLAQNQDDSAFSLESSRLTFQSKTADYETQREELRSGTSQKLVSEQKTVDTAAQSLENSRTSLEQKKKEYENNKLLYEAGVVSKTEIDTFENAYNTAVTDLNTAERLYKNAVDSYEAAKKTLENELASAKRDVESASLNYQNAQNNLSRTQSKDSNSSYTIEGQRLSLEKLRAQFDDAIIKAEIDGTITEINAVVGSSANGILFVIEDGTDLYASISVKEYNLSKVATGQPAIITTDATGREILNGEVSYIAPKAESAGESTTVEFETHVKLNDYDERVKIGMNAFVNVIVASARDVFAVTSDMLVKNQDGNQVIYTLENGIVTEVPVTIGLETATSVEISGNLKDGMLVITNPFETSPGSAVEARVLETVTMRRNAAGGGQTVGGQAGGAATGNGQQLEVRQPDGAGMSRTQTGSSGMQPQRAQEVGAND